MKKEKEFKDAIWWWANLPNKERYEFVQECYEAWKETNREKK